MKRPPGLWCLLIVATFWMCIQDVNSLRATALILGKNPTTTTTTTEAPQEIDVQEVVTEVNAAEQTENVTKHVLTGNPQVDYIWDPNLPRELNGYNLSEYPFYHRLPEDINFKCDGLHDGFYASVPHKCQVYHHCLFGVRYDFLCANYTAFDQRTFICHFVSEVDCVNSKKFWHRNDALYQAASTTTTPKPIIYTPPPAPVTPVPIIPILNRRPGSTGPGRGYRYRKPLKRYEYYDDEYDEEEYEERRYQKRPHYRRPVYEDDEDEVYEDGVYPMRRPSRRRPERRGQTRRNKEERRRYEDDEDYDRDAEEEVRRPNRQRRPNKRRPIEDEDYDGRYERPQKRTRRPIEDDDYDDEVPRRNRNKNRNRDSDGDTEIEDRPKKTKSDDKPRSEGRNNRNEERNRNNDDKPKPKSEVKVKADVNTEEPPLTKAPASVYERKRLTKIRPPLSLGEQTKHVPKTTTSSPANEYEYYDDYEEEEIVKESKRTQDRTQDRNQEKNLSRKPERKVPSRTYFNKPRSSDYDDEEVYKRPTTTTTTKRPLTSKDRRLGSGSRRRPVIEEYDDDNSNKSTEEPTTTTTIKEIVKDTVKDKQEQVIKVVKRPFLPSRGGNPYSARGLLPIGLKSEDDQKVVNLKSNPILKEQESLKQEQPDEIQKSKPLKLKTKSEEEFKPITNRPVSRINIVKITTTTTTEKPIEKNPLDLDENEYDVTLNDALNPTIPNLPIRNFPTGFSSQNDYNYNTVQRNRYVTADPTLNQASSDYVYRIEPLQSSRYVPVYQTFRQAPRQQQAFYAGY